MARKRMKSKIQPAVQTLTFATPNVTVGNIGTYYIDLSQCASLMNRRFYRQGLNWAVAGIKVLTLGEGGVTVQKLPNTWVMSNAWEKGFRAWQEMIKNATDESGSQSIKGKFLDFKIYADKEHHRLGFGSNLLPTSTDSSTSTVFTATAGQWQPAEIEVPSLTGAAVSQAWEIIAVGPNNPGAGASGLDAKSLVVGYANSRALPDVTDPNVPDDASDVGANWMMSMFTDGTQQDSDVTAMLEVTGDRSPYPYENDGTHTDTMYPGGETQLPTLQTHDFEFITSTTVGGTTRLKGGNFPCGLMCITWNPSQSSNLVLQVDLVPGHVRGYLCESMTEM